MLSSLSLCVLGARAAGVAVLDGVFNDIGDQKRFKAECLQAREFGFDGKTLIHPDQIDICNQVFSVSDAEVDHAHRVIAAFEEAERGGAAVATLDGVLIERLHVDEARRTLSNADDA
jgi:citrate lyase subunit beta/citryl-CoA lyase